MANEEEEKNKKRVCINCGRPLSITDYDGLCEECREEERKKKKAKQQDTGEDDENIKAEEEEEERRRKEEEKRRQEEEEEDEDGEDDEDDEDDENEENEEKEEEDNNNNDDNDDDNEEDNDNDNKDGKKEESKEENKEENKDKDNTDRKDENKQEEQKQPDNKKKDDNYSDERPDKPETDNMPESPKSKGEKTSKSGHTETKSKSQSGPEGTPGSDTPGPSGTPEPTVTPTPTQTPTPTPSAEAATAAGGGGAATVLGWVLIIILALIALTGIIVFFLMMPGLVVGKIGEAINDLWVKADIFVNGGHADQILVTRADVAETAEYLSQMGYDLQGYGFLSYDNSGTLTPISKTTKMTAKVKNGTAATLRDKITNWDTFNTYNLPLSDFKTETIEERKKEDPNSNYAIVYIRDYEEGKSDSWYLGRVAMVTDEDGTVTFAMSKYIGQYLATDNSTYLVRNYNMDLGDRLKKLVGIYPSDRDGCGLLYFAKEEADGIKTSDYIEGVGDYKFVGAEASLNDIYGGKVSDIINFLVPELFTVTSPRLVDLVQVDKSYKNMRIYNGRDGWFKKTYYDYNLDGWASRYGIPLQLSLTVHLSTLAPDFAYKFSQIATLNKADDPNTEDDESEGTTVEIGLLEVPDNYVKSKLFIDIGAGKNFYYVEHVRATSWPWSDFAHKKNDGSGEDADGCDTPEDAENNSDNDYESGSKGEKDAQNDNYGSFDDAIADIENALKSETNNGANRKVAGRLVYKENIAGDSNNDSQMPFEYSDASSLYGGENTKVGELATSISDGTIRRMQDLLKDFGDGYYDENGHFRSDYSNAHTQKVVEIVKTYYKLDSIENVVCYKINDNGEFETTLENIGLSIRSGVDSGTLSNSQPEGAGSGPSDARNYWHQNNDGDYTQVSIFDGDGNRSSFTSFR